MTTMKVEMLVLILNQIWELVPMPDNVKPISCRWVYKIKWRADGYVEMCKARLVAQRPSLP